MKSLVLGLAIFLVGFHLTGAAGVYKCKNSTGEVSYSDGKCPDGSVMLSVGGNVSVPGRADNGDKGAEARKTMQTAASANQPPGMKHMVNGSCEEHYWRMEGVCVHATAMGKDAREMKKAIEEFKKTGVAPVSAPPKDQGKDQRSAGTSKEQQRCDDYRKRLAKYEREGVMGVDMQTGKIRKMEGEAAREVIDDTRETMQIVCEGL